MLNITRDGKFVNPFSLKLETFTYLIFIILQIYNIYHYIYGYRLPIGNYIDISSKIYVTVIKHYYIIIYTYFGKPLYIPIISKIIRIYVITL